MNMSTKLKVLFATTIAAMGITALAAHVEITGMDRTPGSGKATVNYTVSGLSTATDLTITASANGKSMSQKIIGVANGTGSATVDYKSELGASPNVAFSAVLTDPDLEGVQLWENGPYWATCNVGASKPEDYGYYFWWGDTVGYRPLAGYWESVKSSATISFSSSSSPANTTYGKNPSGYFDANGNLASSHDAATAYLGAPWRMPTKAELEALIANCEATWETLNGVSGRRIKGKGDYKTKSIFLPATGYGWELAHYGSGSDGGGNYWSSTPGSDLNKARHLNVYSTGSQQVDDSRCVGQSVRAVRVVAK